MQTIIQTITLLGDMDIADPLDQNNYNCGWCISSKSDIDDWCKKCDTKCLVDNFSNWSSGDTGVDELIRNTQREANSKFNFLEWIPPESLRDIEELGKGGFGRVYSATWIDGPQSKWSREEKKWRRFPKVKVALKCLIEDKPDKELFEEIKSHLKVNKDILGRNNTLRIYGITRITGNRNIPEKFMMVMTLGDDGDLRSFINKNFCDLDYFKKLEILFDMITGILQIHRAGLIHRDLHCKNIMCQRYVKPDEGRDDYKFVVGDLGLTRNLFHDHKYFCGRIPYSAPEVIESKKFSKASDIYSFGIIMWELVTGRDPLTKLKRDDNLMCFMIIQGLTPPLMIEKSQRKVHFPSSYRQLMEQCWEREPEKRPSAQKIYETIGVWLQTLKFAKEKEIAQEFREADQKRLSSVLESDDEEGLPQEGVEGDVSSPSSLHSYNSSITSTDKAVYRLQ